MSAANDILGTECDRLEDSRRINAEQAILLSGGRDRFSELKGGFSSACEKISSMSHRLRFECAEPDENTFRIYRDDVLALELLFEPAIPRIRCKDHLNDRQESDIRFAVMDRCVYPANRMLLPEVVGRLLRQISR